MEKDMQKMTENLKEALFQIHGLAGLLEKAGQEADDPEKNSISNPFLCLAQVMREKAAYCLEMLDVI